MQAHPAYEFMKQVIREVWMRYIETLIDNMPGWRFDFEQFTHYFSLIKHKPYVNLADYFLDTMQVPLKQLFCQFMRGIDVEQYRRDFAEGVALNAMGDMEYLTMKLRADEDSYYKRETGGRKFWGRK
jgi:hypothetical protein